MKKYESFVEEKNIEDIKSIIEECGFDSNDPSVICEILEYIENEEKENIDEGLKSSYKPAPLRFGGKGSKCYCKNCGSSISLGDSKYVVFGGITKFIKYGSSIVKVINEHEGEIFSGDKGNADLVDAVEGSILKKDIDTANSQDVFSRIKQFFRLKDEPSYKEILKTVGLDQEQMKKEYENIVNEILNYGNQYLSNISSRLDQLTGITNGSLDNEIGYYFKLNKKEPGDYKTVADNRYTYFISKPIDNRIFAIGNDTNLNKMKIDDQSLSYHKTILDKLTGITNGNIPHQTTGNTTSTGTTSTEEKPAKEGMFRKLKRKIGEVVGFVYPGYKQALWNLLVVNLSGKVYCDPVCKFDHLNSGRYLLHRENMTTSGNKKKSDKDMSDTKGKNVSTEQNLVPLTKVPSMIQSARMSQNSEIRKYLGLKGQGSDKTNTGDYGVKYGVKHD